MVKKQYIKSTRRLFFRHIIRLLSIAAIFIVSIGLMSGLGVVKYNVKQYVDDVYHTCNVHDLDIHDLTEGNVEKLYEKLNEQTVKEKYGIKDLSFSYTYDTGDDSSEGKMFAKRVYVGDYSESTDKTIDKLALIDGRWPKNHSEILANEATNDISTHKIGDKLEVTIGKTVFSGTVVGVVRNPILLAKSKEPSKYYLTNKYKYLNDVIYYHVNDLKQYFATDLSITFNEEIRSKFNHLSKPYMQFIETAKTRIADFMHYHEFEQFKIQTLEECFSFNSLIGYADKVGVIADIFIGFFSLITLLVVFSTMSRLFDEDRESMAVLKTLGYSNFAISMRYVAFIVIAGLIGGALALMPSVLVNNMIIGGFMMQYNLWQISVPIINGVFFFCTGLVLLLSVIITVITSLKAASKKPIELLTPKAPKVGKKILLEKIKTIWNKLTFKYKSTCRNVFLFKGRFFMTFFSIIASTAIVFASLALFDNSLNNTTTGMDLTAIKIISLVLLLFSAILCALVVYNITNINISERKREIATLMVLGYKNNEVKGYIYREIYIMSIISSLIGLPVGVGFVYWVFKLMAFGELGFVNWWTYILTPILTIVFAVLSTLLLNKKITKTDMNESLKVLE